MHIAIPDDYQDAVRGLDCFRRLTGHEVTIFNDTASDLDELASRFAGADALVLIRERTPIGAELLERLPRLRVISQTGKGIAHIDLEACSRLGVAVLFGTGSPYAPAELTWALILAAMRHIPLETARLRSGLWQGTVGRVLRGRTLGIWGYGRIGSIVAGYGRAFGMKVLVWGREGSLTRAAAEGHESAPDSGSLFTRSDVLSLHLRLTRETRSIVGPADFARMKGDSLLVNTSRAELIQEGSLEEGLSRGHPGFAAVDVYEQEPVPGGAHPLLHLDNAICTPHLGYVEKDSYELYFGEAFDQINRFAAGEPVNAANPEAGWKR